MGGKQRHSLVQAARERAESHGSNRIFTFLKANGKEEALTMAELDERARGLAAALVAKGLAGERILLLFPPGIDYVVGFWACLYAKAVAVPAYPPDPKQLDRTLPRLGGILRDSSAKAILTTSTIRWLAQPIFKLRLGLEDVTWVTTKMAGKVGDWEPPPIASDDIAFLQYTSGSTGEPRGVMVSHGNLLANTEMIAGAMDLDSRITGVLWLPPYHDMGLIGGVVQPVVSNMSILLMSPLDFISRPIRWLGAISRYRLRGSGGPNFAFDLCVRRINGKQKADLDLSCWEIAFTGAEPVRSNSLRRFAEEFLECGFRPEAFYPCYGLAEGTVFVAGAARGKPPTVRAFDRDRFGRGEVRDARSLSSVELVGVGRPGAGLDVRIVDPETQELCEPDRVGEIWIAGPSVGLGYWGRDEESEQTFRARLRGPGEEERRFLRTGDLGFFREGELFIAGRMKDLIIVNGTNYYPQDIEAVAERAHKAIRLGATAAFGVERRDGEVLAVVAEANTDGKRELEEAAAAIRCEVTRAIGVAPELIALIPRRALPKTSSGKVRRRDTRAALLDKTLPLIAIFDEWESHPEDDVETGEQDAATLQRGALSRLPPEERDQALTALVIEGIRDVKREAAKGAKPDTPVAELGLDSVHVVELLAEMEERLGVILPMERLARGVTIRELVAAISEELERDLSAGAAPGAEERGAG